MTEIKRQKAGEVVHPNSEENPSSLPKPKDNITYGELKARMKAEDDSLVLRKIILVCLNCGHKGTVEEMRRHKPSHHPYELPELPQPKPDRTYPYSPPYRWRSDRTYGHLRQKKSTTILQVRIVMQIYEEFFRCPKCGSTAVALKLARK